MGISDISYIRGDSDIPLLNDTVADRLRLAVKNVPNKEMIIFPEEGIRKTYQQVFNDARQFAASLIHLGLKKSDRIGIWSPNCYEWIITKYAAAFSGLIIVGINPEYKSDELKYVLQKVEISAIISPVKDETNNYYPGAWNFNEIIKNAGSDDFKLLDEHEKQIQVHDPFNIIFTSGTTGRPKGATLTHYNVINNAYLLGFRPKYQYNQEIFCLPLPLFGCAAFIFGSLSSLCHQGTCIFPLRDAKSILNVIENEKPTILTCLPTLLINILNHPDLPSTDVSTIRGGLVGGATIPEELCKNIINHLGMKLYVTAYGSTETGITAMSYPDDKNILKKMHVMPHIEMAIIDKNGEFVSQGEKGEVVVRGYSVLKKYWNDEKTKEAFNKDKWFYTGDIGTMNSDGCVEICGRIKDVIIRGGYNLYPAEIEQFIVQHSFVADACVIGVPDKLHGEEVCACIQLKPDTILTEKELIDFLSEKISTSKIPRYILFKSHHEFPLTANGKIKKYELQKLCIKELNLQNVTTYCNN
uniref:Uncharacterized protein n=1 Tax=Panagrolaimus sp. PS1159 TaxID=55785 RepID=A0AC35F4B1_9BILA